MIKWIEWVGFACCLIIAFYIRLLPYPVVIQDDSINLFAQDPYYHARRVQLALNNHSVIPTYDSYSGFPEGLYCFWSNIYDYSILWGGKILGNGKPTARDLEISTAYSPVIWGLLSLLPAYLLIRRVFNYRIALLSLFIISLLPGHIYQTLFGRADHYGADPFFPLFMFYFLLNGISSKGNNKIQFYGILTGISIVLSWMVWPGSTIFIGIAILYLVILSIFEYKQSAIPTNGLKVGFIAFITGLFVLFPFSSTSYWGLHRLISYDALSWFQWIFLLIASIYLGLLYVIKKYLLSRENSIFIYLLAIITFTGFIILLTVSLLPEFLSAFINGIGWVGKTDPWLKTITEFQPLFISIGVFSTFRANSYFGYGLYLLPIIYLILFILWFIYKKQGGNQSHLSKILTQLYQENMMGNGNFTDRIWFVCYVITISFLGLNQSRFSHFFALPIAVGFALLIVILWTHREIIIPSKFKSIQKINYLYCICLIVILYLLFIPVIQEIRALRSKYAVIPGPWRETLDWIRENTPQTSYYEKPYRPPEYGILAPWIAGHWINYIAHRPTLSNGFHTNRENNLASMEFYLSENIQKANMILDSKKIRFIILTDITPNAQDYARLLGKEDSEYIYKTILRTPGQGIKISFLPTKKYYELLSTILYINDGSDLAVTQSGTYRLIFETRGKWDMGEKNVHILKVYEYVKGGVIKGLGIPGQRIQVSVPIRTNTGRLFQYQFESQINSRGQYQVVLPYSQKDCPYETSASAPYTIQIGKNKFSVTLDDKSVLQGKSAILSN